MPKMYHPPAPITAPVSGTVDQRLAQMAQAINDLSHRVTSPSFNYIAITDQTGQTWAIYMQTNGQIRTELLTRS